MDTEETTLKILGLLGDIKADVAVIRAERNIDDKRINDIDKRLRGVESLVNKAFGAKAVLCTISSVIGGAIVLFIEWLIAKGN